MLEIKKEGVLLKKTNLGFENEGVLNPAVLREGNHTHIFYRAVGKGNYSSIGYCKLTGPMSLEQRNNEPLLFPQFEYEKQGMEDPRLVKIDDTYYLSYTAYDGLNALGALAISKDLLNWEKLGIIAPQITYSEFSHLAQSKGSINEKYFRYNQSLANLPEINKKVLLWDKNLILFPRKINGKFYFIHRIRPDIQLVCVTDLKELTTEFWQHYFLRLDEHIVLSPKFKHEVSYIGGGCPPIETKVGWLMIYHGVHDTVNGYVYTACAALLDLTNPLIEISRLPYPLFKPELEWELKGEVNNVCFPTGTALFEDTLYIYYGAADERIAAVSLSLTQLLEELMLYKNQNNEK
ncbi:MAG: pesticidal protein Cry7Aa [Bacteroidetes bacterium]|nr:pesticidal protein Cry7Aa [Bacteroidota bacterium]MBK9671669.1 pesticidal protein Cry7Aa [Bacteroidota bacterium]MBK9800563.1 pesticidal protein Cry7Aa [Bacteroidota bacterium]MBP6412103.1 pesticidal protein Cry7Aa [Bacteroidia bacterium]